MYAAKPPVESRSLYSEMSNNPQGTLELWVDILSLEEAEATPPWDIAPPPPQLWELRVVCWKAKDMDTTVDDSGLVDTYVKAIFADQEEKLTDTHFRAREGRASWNWRFKWRVQLDSFIKYQRLILQLWDKDMIPGSDDAMGESTLRLDAWLTRAYRRKLTHPLYYPPPCEPASGGSDFKSVAEAAEQLLTGEGQALLTGEVDEELEAAKFWLPIGKQDKKTGEKKETGCLLLSIELVPIAQVEGRPAGDGRSEPNSHPFLPKPTGRLKFTLNPFAMAFRLLGPKLCRRLSGSLCLIIYLVISWYMVPNIMGNAVWAPFEAVLSDLWVYIIPASLGLLLFCCLWLVLYGCRPKCCRCKKSPTKR